MRPIDREELLGLWKNIEDIPACDMGMENRESFYFRACRPAREAQ
jgi:hypothetical protein